METAGLSALLEAAATGRALVLVGLGGHGAAGKSTLARAVPGAQIVQTDAFWDGRGFDLARLRREVLDPLTRGEPARYEAHDWVAGTSAGTRTVTPRGTVVVEGVCALHRDLRDAYQVRVWVEAPREARLARAVARDGEGAREAWEQVWLPSEERYVARDDPRACAHLVIDNS